MLHCYSWHWCVALFCLSWVIIYLFIIVYYFEDRIFFLPSSENLSFYFNIKSKVRIWVALFSVSLLALDKQSMRMWNHRTGAKWFDGMMPKSVANAYKLTGLLTVHTSSLVAYSLHRKEVSCLLLFSLQNASGLLIKIRWEIIDFFVSFHNGEILIFTAATG